MALQLSHTFKNGLTAPSAYARVSRVTAMHEPGNDNQYIEIKVFADAAAFAANKDPEVINVQRAYDDTSTVTMAALYTWLKTAYSEDAEGNPTGGPEGDIFVGAIDV